MNINAKVCQFIETRLNACEGLKAYFAAGMGLYYGATIENPPKPYIIYDIQEPTILDRNLALQHYVYQIVVNVNVIGNSVNQIREISQAIFEEFDGDLSPEGFKEIQDVKASYPLENLGFDGQTTSPIFETSQTLDFYLDTFDRTQHQRKDING